MFEWEEDGEDLDGNSISYNFNFTDLSIAVIQSNKYEERLYYFIENNPSYYFKTTLFVGEEGYRLEVKVYNEKGDKDTNKGG